MLGGKSAYIFRQLGQTRMKSTTSAGVKNKDLLYFLQGVLPTYSTVYNLAAQNFTTNIPKLIHPISPRSL